MSPKGRQTGEEAVGDTPPHMRSVAKTALGSFMGNWPQKLAARMGGGKGALSVVVGLLMWEWLVGVAGISPLAIATPSAILREAWVVTSQGILWPHLRASAIAYTLGMGIALFISVPLGLLIGQFASARAVFRPWIAALYATPMIALAPLLILSLGFGLGAKVSVVAYAAFFPLVINTLAGVDAITRELVDVSKAFDLSKAEEFRYLLLPGSMPFVFAGIELAIGRGIIGLVVADLFGTFAGLGLMLLEAARVFNTARIFFVAVLLAVSGVLLTAILRVIERRVFAWRLKSSVG